jgi:hypothetical protein
MKINFYPILKASPVSDGYYFKAIFTWWQILAVLAVTILIIYLIKKNVNKTSLAF